MKPIGGLSPRTAVLLVILLLTAAAYVAVARVRSRASIPTLDDRLHGDADEASDALEEIEDKTPPDRVEGLLLTYSNDSSPILRHLVLDELTHYKDQAAIDTEEKGFSDSSSDVRYSALYNLSKLDHDRGLRLLASGLHDQDTLIRQSAALDIKNSGDKRIVPNLIAALDDPDPSVVHLAIGDLHKIAGRPWEFRLTAPEPAKQTVILHWVSWWGTARNHWAIDPSITQASMVMPTRVDPAPAFDLPDVDGRPLSLAGQRGHITLLNFWGTWCPPCLEEIPDLIQLDKTYRGRGVDVIGIAANEPNASTLRDWCRAHDVKYRQAMATDQMLDAYGQIHSLPISVLIDGRGRIRYRWEDPRDFATFSAAVDRLLKE